MDSGHYYSYSADVHRLWVSRDDGGDDDGDGGEDDGDGEEVVGTELALAPSLEPHSQWWAPTSLGLSS